VILYYETMTVAMPTVQTALLLWEAPLSEYDVVGPGGLFRQRDRDGHQLIDVRENYHNLIICDGSPGAESVSKPQVYNKNCHI
jgi:hypothetical protein